MNLSRKFFIYILLCLSPFLNQGQNIESLFSKVDAFMKFYVSKGLVDYQALKNNPTKLNLLSQEIGSFDLSQANGVERKAFYVNAYNVLTIKQIVDNYPVKSPQKINGFWDSNLHKVAGEEMTLNHLEHKKLLGDKKDPRLHFVLVCAAKGCPKLASFAYTPSKLEDQLQNQTRKIINSDFIQVNKASKTVGVSEIFKWYKSDFATKGKTYKDFIVKFRPIDLNYTFSYYTYDWSLNDDKSKK